MARIRTVKPELFRHEGLFELEQETGLPIRLAFIGLFTSCDREGRFKWRPRTLKLDALPHDDVDFTRVLDALASRCFVVKYEVDGREYGCIPTFTTHQNINNKESASALPGPEEGNAAEPESAQPATRQPTREPREDNATSGEGKGKEGKGKEGNARRSDAVLVKEIYDYWVHRMGKNAQAKLTDKRRKCIQTRLKDGYDVEFIKRAIDGCAASPHHMGQNDQGTVYDDLTLICRAGDKLEWFANNVAKVKPTYLNPGAETLEQFADRAKDQADRSSHMLNDLPDIYTEEPDA